MSTEKPFKIFISFGTEPERPEEYSFATPAELTAFIYGVSEANGWMEYSIVGEKDVWIYSLGVGDKVKWNDPDSEICSRVLTINEIQIEDGCSVLITDDTGDEVECPFDELEEVKS